MQDQLQEVQYRLANAERRFWMLGCLAVAIIVGSILMSVRPAATAQSGPGGIPARVEALETKVAALQAVNTTLQSKLDAEIAARKQGDAIIETELVALQLKTQFITVDGTDMDITGANLHILNGMGGTSTVNGLGNLIVGYNPSRVPFGGTDVRTGSHNIIAGDYNNYSSFGGLVIGFVNTISNSYSSVSGGSGNLASGALSSVTGGTNNTASGYYSSVTGGIFNEARDYHSSVSGGVSNLASGNSSSVSGGSYNWANGPGTSISGGWINTASDYYSSVSGGYGNLASGETSSVSGGAGNTASHAYSSVSGGANNTAGGDYSSVGGGYYVTQSILFGWSGGSTGAAVSGSFRSP